MKRVDKDILELGNRKPAGNVALYDKYSPALMGIILRLVRNFNPGADFSHCRCDA